MTTPADRLADLSRLVADRRETMRPPLDAYAHGDVAAELLAYCLGAIPEDRWVEAMTYAASWTERRRTVAS